MSIWITKSSIVITHNPADFMFFCWNTISDTKITFLPKVFRWLKIILWKIKTCEWINGPCRCLAILIQWITAMPHMYAVRPCSHLFRFAFRSRFGPVPLVRVAFTPAKIDRTRSGCGPVKCSHLFRNATGTRTVTPQHTRFLILGLLSSRRVTALTASRHRRRRSRIDGQIRRCVMFPNFGLQRNFGRCIFI